MTRSEDTFADVPVATVRAEGAADWQITSANALACKLLGYPSPENLLKLHLAELFETPVAWELLRHRLAGAGSQIVRAETVLRKQDGSAVAVTVQAAEADGVHVLALVEHDGSADRAALIESEERYRVLVEGAGETICAIDRDGVFRFMNTTAAARLGGRPEDYIGKTSWDAFPREIADRHMAAVRQVIDTGEELATDSREMLQGRTYWYRTTVRPLRDARGRVTMAMIIARNVTERKEAVDALQQSEERYRTLFNNIPVAVYRTTPDGRILDANPGLYHLFGSTPEEGLLPAPPESYVNPDDRRRWKEQLEADGVVRDFEVEMLRVDGSRFWARNTGRLIRDAEGRPQYFQGSLEDITERHQARTALAESEEKYRQLFTMGSDGILLFDEASGRFIDANDSALRLFGYTRSEFLALSYTDITAEREASDATFEVLQGGRAVRIPVRYYRKKDGTVFPVEISASTITLDGHKIMCGVVHDITERLWALKALEESEEKFRTLAENTDDTLFSLDVQGRVTYIGPQAERYGLLPEKVVGREFTEFLFPEDREFVRADFERSMVAGTPVPSEFRILGADGGIRWMEERSTVQRDAAGAIIGLMGVLRDITFRKQAEAESLRYQDRLRSLAMELSLTEEQERKNLAMAMHDGPVQMLSVIKMRLSLLDQDARKAGTEKSIAEIRQLVDRATRLSRSLMLHMSHPALYEMGLVAAAEWLAEDMEELQGLKVELTGRREADPFDQRTRVVLFQCLRELLVNVAKHASTDRAAVRIAWTGGTAQVTVEDQGTGFDPEAARRKRSDSGFGLFSIDERLHMLGGRLEIRSAPGRGTTVVMEVPFEHEPSTAKQGGAP